MGAEEKGVFWVLRKTVQVLFVMTTRKIRFFMRAKLQ